MKIWPVLLLLAWAVEASTTIEKESNTVILNFENYVGAEELVLDTPIYRNSLNQGFDVSKLRYYVSNISLVNSTGKDFSLDEYFLVDEDKKNSGKILLPDVEQGEYTALSFILGVDSIHNCSGIQSGALDPVNGMFWAWNTGYIFLKLEGHSPDSKSHGNFFEYHIGGYRNPVNCIRRITLVFAKPLRIEGGGNRTIHVKSDISEILKNPESIDFSKLSTVTDHNNAVMMAENYKDMFSIIELSTE